MLKKPRRNIHVSKFRPFSTDQFTTVTPFKVVLDVNMMLIGGFGFLMTFLKRYGFSALGLTLLIVVLCTEWSILLWGFTKLDASFTIHLNLME